MLSNTMAITIAWIARNTSRTSGGQKCSSIWVGTWSGLSKKTVHATSSNGFHEPSLDAATRHRRQRIEERQERRREAGPLRLLRSAPAVSDPPSQPRAATGSEPDPRPLNPGARPVHDRQCAARPGQKRRLRLLTSNSQASSSPVRNSSPSRVALCVGGAAAIRGRPWL